jgi:hypothetical protein
VVAENCMSFHGLYTSPKMFRVKDKNEEMGGAFDTHGKEECV